MSMPAETKSEHTRVDALEKVTGQAPKKEPTSRKPRFWLSPRRRNEAATRRRRQPCRASRYPRSSISRRPRVEENPADEALPREATPRVVRANLAGCPTR